MELYKAIKRNIDIVGSAAALLVTAPVCAASAALIKRESSGPVIFLHNRIGKNGSKITVYKFRSMRFGSENLEMQLNDDELEQYYQEYRLDDDPRVTKTGRLLRKTYLDELPQLINILRGDMSLVGPRPVTEEELSFYADDEKKRFLSVMPGLTGYWQVFGRGRATYQNGERMRMELFYADHASLLFDSMILFFTPASVISSLIKRR